MMQSFWYLLWVKYLASTTLKHVEAEKHESVPIPSEAPGANFYGVALANGEERDD